ncbi:MAG: hypothetical protein DIKNOCCD_01478 [bacterium]|nr:hypothetical protein [bacterium]
MDHTHLIPRFIRLLIDDPAGIRAVISSDVEKVTDIVGLADFEYLSAIFHIGFVACGVQSGRWSLGDCLEIVCCRFGQIEEIFIDDPTDTMLRAINTHHLGEFPRFENRTHQALVDDSSWATALGNQDFSIKNSHNFFLLL